MSFDSYALINLKLQLPPPLPHGNQQAFDCHLCLWVRYLNLAGWDGAFELGGSSLQDNTQVYRGFKGKESAFVSEWFRKTIFIFECLQWKT